jgi:hypothetical protein
MNSPRKTHSALGAALALCLAAPIATAEAVKPDRAGPHETAGAPASPPATCGYGEPSKVFAAWRDNKNYVLTENGGFEAGDAGWTLAGGAAVVEGNEPFLLNGAADHQSLSLPAGSSATGPATCVASGQPVFRFVARTSGNRRSRLKVEVLYLSSDGSKRSAVVGKLRGGDKWRPTKRLAVRLGLAKPQGRMTTAEIAFRFTPLRAGDWQIDDVFLDPRLRR